MCIAHDAKQQPKLRCKLRCKLRSIIFIVDFGIWRI